MPSIGGLAINNPLSLANTAVKPVNNNSNLIAQGAVGAANAVQFPTAAPVNNAPAITTTAGSTLTPAQTTAQNEFNSQMTADQGALKTSIGSAAGDYKQSILDLVNSNKNSQNTINSQAVQNELARDQGIQGVTDMVSNGIQGGGVVLDNDNAGTSSAGDALARAYGVQGRQSASQVGNQYAQGENTINNSQTALNNDEGTQISDVQQKKVDTITSIVNSANSSLQYLDSLAASANITDLPNINQQIAQVKQQATAALSAYDSELSGAKTAPNSVDANRATAQGLFTAGTAAAQPFNFTDQAPATLQGTGPTPSSLPIFIAPQTDKNNRPALA